MKLKNLCLIIIDLETSGLNFEKNSILEITLINTKYNKNGEILPDKTLHLNINPFNGAKINKNALKCNKINIFQPLRFSITEKEASLYILEFIKKTITENNGYKCLLVGHNCWFDLIFLNNLINRTKKTNHYYHKFNVIDASTLGYITYKQSILSKISKKIGIKFNNKKNHSAIYDAKVTTLIFCHIINKIKNKLNN